MLVKQILSPCSIEILKCAEEAPNPSHTHTHTLPCACEGNTHAILVLKVESQMHCILVHLFRGKAVPRVSILNSEMWNRKFRNLGFQIPKLWIPKTAQVRR